MGLVFGRNGLVRRPARPHDGLTFALVGRSFSELPSVGETDHYQKER